MEIIIMPELNQELQKLVKLLKGTGYERHIRKNFKRLFCEESKLTTTNYLARWEEWEERE